MGMTGASVSMFFREHQVGSWSCILVLRAMTPSAVDSHVAKQLPRMQCIAGACTSGKSEACKHRQPGQDGAFVVGREGHRGLGIMRHNAWWENLGKTDSEAGEDTAENQPRCENVDQNRDLAGGMRCDKPATSSLGPRPHSSACASRSRSCSCSQGPSEERCRPPVASLRTRTQLGGGAPGAPPASRKSALSSERTGSASRRRLRAWHCTRDVRLFLSNCIPFPSRLGRCCRASTCLCYAQILRCGTEKPRRLWKRDCITCCQRSSEQDLQMHKA